MQRKLEYENFRFKYPTLLGIVVETLPNGILEGQKDVGVFNFRFHISQTLTLGEIGEVLKFKINTSIEDELLKLGTKDKVVMFNNGTLMFEGSVIKDLYYEHREEDGWLYIDIAIV